MLNWVTSNFLAATRNYYAQRDSLGEWLQSVDTLFRQQDQWPLVPEIFFWLGFASVREKIRLEHVGALVFEKLDDATEQLKKVAADVDVVPSVLMAEMCGRPLHIVRGRMPCPVCSTCEDRFIELFVVDPEVEWPKNELLVRVWSKLGKAMHFGFVASDADVVSETTALLNNFALTRRFTTIGCGEHKRICYLDGFLENHVVRIEVSSCL